MPGTSGYLKTITHKLWFWYLVVFLLSLLAHVIIFRDVVAAIPAIWHGDQVIVREELVPFFDFGTQFWGDDAAGLTSSEEVRTAYSFWTAWFRFAPILPIALVVVNALSAFLLFFAFHRVGRYFSKHRPYFGVVAAALAAAVIHGILLYSKIAHFYVLIIGFSLFAVAISLVIDQVFFHKKLKWTNVVMVSLLVLINPAVHYHLIFYLLFILILMVYNVLVWVVNREYFGYYLKKHLIYMVSVIVCSLVPYVLLIMALIAPKLSTVSTDIPVNYWLIFYSSLPLPFIFSFDSAGHLDLMRYGNYLAPLPRIGSMIITGLVGSLFLFGQWAKQSLVRRVLLATLFMIMLIAMWMSMGYSPSVVFSFHAVLSSLATFLSEQGNAFAAVVGKGLAIFINILRFPHRFQFIYFYVGGLLMMIALVWLHDLFRKRMANRLAAGGLVVLVGLLPLYASVDYRQALTSGNFATFATPYRVSDDLRHIKDILSRQTDDKLFIFPTLESGREILQDGKSYSYLDKFLVYYLNQPALYYGVGASTQNKLVAYLTYRSIAFNESWWQDILVNNLNITHVLMPKNVQARKVGIAYLPGVESKIAKALSESQTYQLEYDGPEFALYSLRAKKLTTTPTLVDMQWSRLLEAFRHGDFAQRRFTLPLQVNDSLKQDTSSLLTDSPERSFYTLFAATEPGKVFYPNSDLLPFASELVASSNFTNNALSLSTLYAADDDYNYIHEVVPNLTSLRVPQFTGLTKGAGRLSVPFTVPTDGTYRVVLHGGSRADDIKAHLGGQQVTLSKIESDAHQAKDYVDFTYFHADLQLVAGSHVLEVQNASQNAVLSESLVVVPQAEIPKDFANATTAHFSIKPSDQPDTFTVVRGKRE